MDKTFVLENGGGGDSTTNALLANLVGKSGIDPAMMAMMNQNGGFGGQNGMFMMLFLLLLLGRNGLGGLGGDGAAALNTAENSQLLMNAINGNNAAIRDLAAATNTSITAVNGALASLNTQLATLGGQVGMSTQQVINSIQMGNSGLASQLAACCCEVKTTILTQGYENRLAEVNQTNQLTGTMNTNNRAVLDKLDAIEDARLREKIESQRIEISTLNNEISQRNQNAYLGSQINEVKALANSIACKQPMTYQQPYIPGNPYINIPYSPFGYGGATPFGAPGFGGCGCNGHHNHHHGNGGSGAGNP